MTACYILHVSTCLCDPTSCSDLKSTSPIRIQKMTQCSKKPCNCRRQGQLNPFWCQNAIYMFIANCLLFAVLVKLDSTEKRKTFRNQIGIPITGQLKKNLTNISKQRTTTQPHKSSNNRPQEIRALHCRFGTRNRWIGRQTIKPGCKSKPRKKVQKRSNVDPLLAIQETFTLISRFG